MKLTKIKRIEGKLNYRRDLILPFATLFWSSIVSGVHAAYIQTNLVSNNPAYNPQLLDPLLQGSRSIAIRPAGFGGHFWINNLVTGTNTVYVGDVNNIPLFQDELTVVDIPASPNNPSGLSLPTGQVFNNSSDFVITINHPNGLITDRSKFLFGSLDGTITAWTDRANPNNHPDWPTEAVIVIDRYEESMYQGVTVSDLPANNRLYAVDFGVVSPGIEVFDSTFTEITSSVQFSNPFVAEGYTPYNIQTFNGSLFVTYAQHSTLPGEEKVGAGLGRLAQFDFDGNLLAAWFDHGLLNIPAGMAIAPDNFGEFSGALLVANFGDGTITAFDQNTKQALGYLQDTKGNPIVIPGLWGLTFGNGASLGEINHLYFAAAPRDGTNDGLFGKLQVVPEPLTMLGTFTALGFGYVFKRRVAK